MIRRTAVAAEMLNALVAAVGNSDPRLGRPLVDGQSVARHLKRDAESARRSFLARGAVAGIGDIGFGGACVADRAA